MAKSHKHDQDTAHGDQRSGSDRDEKNKARFVDQTGREASELPHSGRPSGHNDTVMDVGRRNLPDQHGGEMTDGSRDDQTGADDGGLRGDRNIGDASIRGAGGGRGGN